MTETKICTKCKVEKPITEFGRHKSYKSGIKTHCRECVNAAESVWRKDRLSNPEYKERYNRYIREYTARKRQENSEYHPRVNKVCVILKNHSEELKDDPDHLSTEFLQKLIGVKCK